MRTRMVVSYIPLSLPYPQSNLTAIEILLQILNAAWEMAVAADEL